MTREIGSEFNLDFQALDRGRNKTIKDHLSLFHTVYTDSGRSAIAILAKKIGAGRILLPDYICASVIDSFSCDQEIEYYRINNDFSIDMDDLAGRINEKTKMVYLISYFGATIRQETISELNKLREKYPFIIVEDTSHSIFSNPNAIGDYCICSLRKWFPIPDGGVLYSQNEVEPVLKQQDGSSTGSWKAYAMVLKTLYLTNGFDDSKTYRRMFADAEKYLDEKTDAYPISLLSEFLLEHYDVDKMIRRRRENYSFLLKELGALSVETVCSIDEGDCPFTLPINSSKRDQLREYLTENQIYCAVHWPKKDVIQTGSKGALMMSGRILSLPIDQRYDEDDMTRIVETLRKAKGLF